MTLWKKQLLPQLAEVFESGTALPTQSDEPQATELYKQIGRLKVELEWL